MSETLPEIGVFLAEYCSWLLGSQATCIRVEKNLRRISQSFGVHTEMDISPSHVHLYLSYPSSTESYVCVRQIRRMGASFNISTQLSRLSWRIADEGMSFAEAKETFETITKETTPEDSRLVILLVSLANMSFCRLFGGDPTSMLIVFVATFMGYFVKVELLRRHLDVRLVFFISAFASSVIASGGFLFGWGSTPDIALGTSVLYLIPGIPYINSVSDLLDGHYVSALNRFVDATTLTACLSLGLCLGMSLMGLRFFDTY